NNVVQYDHIACYDEADYDRFEMLWKSRLDYAERLSGLSAFVTEMTLAGRCVLLGAGTPVTYEKRGATNRQCVRLPGDFNCAWTGCSQPCPADSCRREPLQLQQNGPAPSPFFFASIEHWDFSQWISRKFRLRPTQDWGPIGIAMGRLSLSILCFGAALA